MSMEAVKNSPIKGKNKKESKPKRPEKKPRPPGDWLLSWERLALASRPVDYTFNKLKELKPMEPEDARVNRLGILARGPGEKLLSRSLWLNHNKLTSVQNIHELVNSAMEFPHLLGYLDISCNNLKELHSDLFRYPNITVLYLHGNKLSDPKDIYALRQLKRLQHVTMYANPWCERRELGNMRQLVASYLPNLKKLDHNCFTSLERNSPLSAYALKILDELTGQKEDWLFRQFPKPALTPEIRKLCDPKVLERVNNYFDGKKKHEKEE